ncbi:acid protease [Hypoxylon trugodes]|uniref:acid protease n=1 Tax=Hypoxylon trugodes TaxID=326681 RepID=UPI00218DD1D8|nr:acid protease [Hypoxylon trugodes]KAI1388696.1 acid protease [Hypoxylon trugodes]
MAYFSSALAALAFYFSLFAVVTSSPALHPRGSKTNTFSVGVSHDADAPRHGPSDYLKILKKHKLNIPDGLQDVVDTHKTATKEKAAVADGGSSSAPATSHDGDLVFMTPVSIGTPPQQLSLDLDTASSDTWVFSTDTDKKMVDGQTLWDPSKSSTSQSIKNCSWSMLYGDYSTSRGICYKDTLAFGDLSIPDMTIESATSVSEMFTESSYDSGIVGLAWPSIAETTPRQKTLLDLLPQVLSQPLFTVDLRHNSSDGSFNFGYINDQLHDSDIQYVNINNSEGFWGVTQSGFGIEGISTKYEFNEAREVIVDTGSTLLLAPDEAVKTYFDNVPGANYSYADLGFHLPCNSTPPDFIFEISDDAGGKIMGSIPGKYFIYALASEGMCYAGIQSSGYISGTPSIFGDVFLKSGFAVFDIGNERFGFASKPNLDTNLKKRNPETQPWGLPVVKV